MRRSGYTGPLFLVVDNEDKFGEEYIKSFGADNVILFDKAETAKTFDEFDNFNDRRAIVYARNECFSIARKLGFKHFLQLDDDYESFGYRLHVEVANRRNKSDWLSVRHTGDQALAATLELFNSVPAASIAFSQGGDWFNGDIESITVRKCMNTFFCSTDRPFQFVGRINEDVNTYTCIQGRGLLFLTLPHFQIVQKHTQANSGGMADLYLAQGTYIKSFYTVICSPSCVKVRIMGSVNRRLHHKIEWDNAVPCILDDRHVRGERELKRVPPPRPPGRVMTVAEINSQVEWKVPQQALTTTSKSISEPEHKPELKGELDSKWDDYWKQKGFQRDPKANIQNI
jgi:hypothetical protein